MPSKAKVAVCSDIHTKHSTQSERHVEFFNFKPWWYVKKPLGFKRCVQVLRSPKEAFAAAMLSWRERCEKCVCLQGDYVEK